MSAGQRKKFTRALPSAHEDNNCSSHCFVLILDDLFAVLRSEIPSGMCAELRTVAASNNRDHPTRSLPSSPFASTINCSPGSQALLEVTHQDHSIGITLLLLVRATYMYGVVLHAHPVRGESHNQRNTTGEVATAER